MQTSSTKSVPPADAVLVGSRYVAEILGLNPRAIYTVTSAPDFPRRVQLTKRKSWFLKHQVDAWLRSRGIEPNRPGDQFDLFDTGWVADEQVLRPNPVDVEVSGDFIQA